MKNFNKLLTSAAFLTLFLLVAFSQGAVFDFYRQGSSFLATVFSQYNPREVSRLKQKNEQLKFQIKKLSKLDKKTGENEYLEAKVFSRYPFNDRETFKIDVGKKDGIKKGMTVLTPQKYLLGEVKSTQSRISEVRTIFDSQWKNSVGLGKPKVEAVLKGANPPEINLIPEDSKVEEGVKVFNLSPDYPLYQLMGELGKLTNPQDGVLNKGKLKVPYQLGNLNEVLVVTNFP